MYNGQTVGAVVPAHNEEGFVGDVIDSLPDIVDRGYVIDDCSTDGTWAEIERHADGAGRATIADGGEKSAPEIVPIRHEQNRGRGGAVKTGYRRALEDGMDVVVVLDGDGQMDPGIMHRFVGPVAAGEVDYAKGNRLLSPEHRRGMSRFRFFGNGVLTFLTKIASGYWRMMDPQNGYTAVSADALREIRLDDVYDGYGFLNDMLVKLNAREMRIGDVAMRAEYGDEESGIRYTTFVPRLSSLLLSDFLWRLKVKYLVLDFHPLVQLYGLGAASALVGVGFLGWLAAGSGITPAGGVLCALLFLLAGLFVTLAMTFDRANNAHLERRFDDHGGRAQ